MSTRATRDQSRATGSRTESAGLVTPQVVETPLDMLANVAITVETTATRTRSGRVSKPPVRYEPIEQVEDDYGPDDYDSDESEILSDDSFGEDEDEEDDEDDADEDGNLDGFVVPDKSETSDSESDGEPAVSHKKQRAVVKKRPAPRK